jgi:hypothetical protein
MATRHRTRRRNPDPDRMARTPIAWDQMLERMAAGLALTLLISRPLFPSEDADSGTGLLAVALWGLTLCLWGAAQAMRGQIRLFLHWLDLGPIALLAAVSFSGILAGGTRPVIVMTCEWCALVLSYFLVRQLFHSTDSQRVIVRVMVAVAVALAAYGVYQSFWGLDALRAEYSRDRLNILQSLNIPPGSLQEKTFENRLNSHEPFATFALANSLAGFLVAWLPIAIAWWFSPLLAGTDAPAPQGVDEAASTRRTRSVPAIAGAFIVAIIFLCLILTQSRTAYVGTLVQLVLLSLVFGRDLIRQLRRVLSARALKLVAVGSCIAIVCFVLVAWRRGKIDEMVITQAAKSFGYRLQYWQATSHLIAERPWHGTGPGNFRSPYLRYKLPESSEEIADPHNMVLEVAATSGVVAGVVLVVCLVSSILVLWRRSVSPDGRAGPLRAADVWVAGAAAFVFAGALSPIGATTYFRLFAVWCASCAIVNWRAAAMRPDSRVVSIAVIGMSVHLLGAGGIGMPGVSQSLWALMAMGVNASEGGREPSVFMGRSLARSLLAGAVALWVAFVVGVLRPVTASTSALTLGRRLEGDRDWAAAEVQFRAAAELDPRSVEPWIDLSRIHYQRWRASRGRAAEEQFAQARLTLEAAHRLAPDQLEPLRLLAGLYEARGAESPALWGTAAEWYRQCVERYPASAALHARHAHALAMAGQRAAAQESARRALQLDAQTPHVDRKLTDEERRLIEPLQAQMPPVE